jgi:hypothetical protein
LALADQKTLLVEVTNGAGVPFAMGDTVAVAFNGADASVL